MECVLGLDIGTTSTIGILIALPDQVLAQVSRPVTFSAPKPGWAEEDPEEWWRNVCAIIPELLEKANLSATDIRAVGVTGMLPALVVLDEYDTVIRPSIQQSDGRCGEQVAQLKSEINEDEFTQIAGNGINQQLVAAKLRWLRQHEREGFDKIATIFGSYDFINWKLTGKKVIEQNWALEAGFVDLRTNNLSDALIGLGSISPDVVPPKLASHEVLGAITKEAAAQTGLAEGTVVIGGAADHIASAFAAGVTKPGDILLKFGGAVDIMIATQKAVPDPRMFLDYHLMPDMFMPNGCMASGGSALNWFVDKIASGHGAAADAAGLTLHQYLDRISLETDPGADGVQVIPYFLGEKTPLHDADARGIIHGLSLNHDLRHIWRALLEGFAYAIRHHVEVFNDMGHPTNQFLASDGGSNSAFWMQICADVLQEPVQLLNGHPGSSLGAAWVAMMGVGLSEDWSGVSKFVTYGDIVEPIPATAKIYEEGYSRFRATYEAQAKVQANASDAL